MIGWLIKLSILTFQKSFLISEEVILCITSGDVHPLIGYCLRDKQYITVRNIITTGCLFVCQSVRLFVCTNGNSRNIFSFFLKLKFKVVG